MVRRRRETTLHAASHRIRMERGIIVMTVGGTALCIDPCQFHWDDGGDCALCCQSRHQHGNGHKRCESYGKGVSQRVRSSTVEREGGILLRTCRDVPVQSHLLVKAVLSRTATIILVGMVKMSPGGRWDCGRSDT